MKKLTLRAEHLGELSADELRQVAGAAGAAAAGTISDGSCVCGDGQVYKPCDVSAGSCVCGIDTRTYLCTIVTA